MIDGARVATVVRPVVRVANPQPRVDPRPPGPLYRSIGSAESLQRVARALPAVRTTSEGYLSALITDLSLNVGRIDAADNSLSTQLSQQASQPQSPRGLPDYVIALIVATVGLFFILKK